MHKFFTRYLLLPALFILFNAVVAHAQTITVGAVDPGPYGQGSTIAVPITVNDASNCTPPGTTYTLYLSNAAGNFAPGTVIGTYNEFYATFVNGKIPNGTPAGAGYKVEVKSSTGVVSSVSNAFTISAGTGVVAGVVSQLINTAYPEVFGQCTGGPNSPFAFTNNSTAGSTTTATFYNELTKTTEQSNATIPNAGSYTFTANTGNYTVSIKSTNGGIVGTYDYQLVNNVVNVGITTSGSQYVCLNNGQGVLTINVVVSTSTGIQYNYPGDLYNISWGDGTSTTATLCDLIASSGNVTHTYTQASCGNNLVFQVTNDLCGNIGARQTSSVAVVIPPTNKFTVPAASCAGTAVTIKNQSDPGIDPNSCNPNTNALYTWLVDGVNAQANVPLGTDFILPATTPAGSHVITLHLQNGAANCTATDVSHSICLQSPPQPIFALPGATVCLSGGPVIPNNTSIVDNGCGATNQYIWTVTGPSPVTYAGGTNANSQQPQFVFTQSGVYQVKLAIATSTNCGTVTAGSQTLIVNDVPKVTLSPNATLCGNNQLLTFDPNPGPTQSSLTGTAQPAVNTYTWTVAGGAFIFQGGTTPNSQYPQILFSDLATYTITATEQNNCGNVTKTQTLTFVQAPTVNAGTSPPVCANNPVVALAGTITGTATSFTWQGGTGTFSAGRNSLNTNYTPSATEIAAGTVTLTLQATTSLPAPCNLIGSNITISITPIDNVTSQPAVPLCTGQPLNYAITSTSGGPNFTWTGTVTSGTATGVTASGTGNNIGDIITDTDPNNPATVVYKITPQNNGCTGNVFTLTVTVNPLPKITAIPAASPICSNQPANIVLTTNIPNTTYTWSSIAAPGITGNTNQANAVQTNAIQDVLINNGTAAGTVKYTITPYNGTCPGAPITATVTVQPLPVVSNPGPDDEVCATTTYTLQGNNPAPGTGLWTIVSGPAGATLTNPTSPNAVVTGLVPGNKYQFQWTITATPSCPPSTNAVNIIIDLQTIGGTTATTGAATVCSTGNAGQITLSGQQGNILRWESSTDNGATWQPIVNVSATQDYANLIQTTQYRAVVQSGKCAALPSAATTIIVNQAPPQADAGPDFAVCNVTSATLAGNDPGTFTGVWTQAAGPAGTIANINDPHSQVTGLIKGNTYTFTWTIQGQAPCGNTQASVNVTVSADVTAAFTADKIQGCGPTTVTFTNTSTPSPVGNYLWDFGDGATSTATDPAPHTFQPSTNGKEMSYTVTLTPVSNCNLKTPFTMTITVEPAVPVAVINPNQTAACGAFTLTVQNLSPGNNVAYDFYLTDAGGNILQHVSKTDKSDVTFQPINPTKPTDYTVYLTATDQCGNKGSNTPIIVSVAPSSLISLVQLKGDQRSVCLGGSVVFQNISTGGDRFKYIIYDSNKNPVATIPAGAGDLNYTPTAVGTYYVSITAGNNGCGDAPESVLKEFTVYPDPQPSFTYTLDEQYNVTFTNTTPDDGDTPASSLDYTWDFGDGDQTHTNNAPLKHHYDYEKSPFKVTMTATNAASGCAASVSQTVIVKFLGNIYLPNAFMPTSTNGELNTFKAKGTQIKQWKMQVFNNFGELVWETTKLDADGSPVEGWDGTFKGVPAQQGVYVWQISATFVNGGEWKGMSYKGSLPKRTGVIHLIR